MKVTYLDHSGFLLELKDRYCIFDYYKGELPPLDKEKEVLVFCSHSHRDHYNPKIFDLLDERGLRYRAVLANDISDEKRLSKIEHCFVEPDQSYQLESGIQVETLLSNDSGVAFIVSTEEGSIYHAGDLNDWYWEGEPEEENRELHAIFHTEIGKIKGRHFDCAFVPLDPRLEAHYADGLLYFLENVDCDAVFPIHYWGDAAVIQRFLTEYPQYSARIKKYGDSERRRDMKFRMIHENLNVADLERSIRFYNEALDLHEVRRKTSDDFIIVYLKSEVGEFELELTWLKDHPQPYDLGECEFHLAFRADDFDAAHKKHKEMGCICFENEAMGIYFIEDPDGYWLEILP